VLELTMNKFEKVSSVPVKKVSSGEASGEDAKVEEEDVSTMESRLHAL
jgi:hypothetical protein